MTTVLGFVLVPVGLSATAVPIQIREHTAVGYSNIMWVQLFWKRSGGIIKTACQMFLLGRHCRARPDRVLCDSVVLCSPVQSSVLFVPNERLPLPFTANTALHSLRGTKAPLLWGENGCKCEHSVSLLSLRSVCPFFSFLKCLSQFVLSIHSCTDVPRNFTVKLVTKTTVLLSWKFYDSRFPYKCTVSKASCMSSLTHTHLDVTVQNLSIRIYLQIEYHRQKSDIDARMTKTLITNLRPNTTYEFRISCQDSSDGGPKHKLVARTAPHIQIRKPELDLKRESESTLTIVFPPLETKDLIK